MRPLENRFLRLVPALEETPGVVLPPSPRVAQRSAGVPLLQPVTAPDSLPATADFSASGQSDPNAFFMIGRDLFRGSSNQILRDARSALQIPTESPFLYPNGIFERIGTAARRREPAVELPAALPEGNTTFNREWLRVLLWLTYSDAPTRLAEVRLPGFATLPELGDVLWFPPGPEASSSLRVTRGFDPTLLASNPFASRVLTGEEFHIGGDTEPPPERSSSGGGGLLLVGLGALALLLLGGRR